MTFVERCMDWLQTDEAVKAAKRASSRLGLPLDPLDFVSEVTVKILAKAKADPGFFAQPKFVTAKVDGYCARTMHNYAADLLRGVKRDRDIDRLLQVEARNDADVHAVPDITESERAALEQFAMERVDALRVAAEYSGAKEVVVSGALTVWAIRRDPTADIGVSPMPLAGATPDQARLWPAIWFAGVRDKAFPSSGASSTAQQKYRARLATRISEFLGVLEVWDEVDPL